MPATHQEYWEQKISRNRSRDVLVTRTLEADGWRVLRVWEHELKADPERVADWLMQAGLGPQPLGGPDR